jgi:mannonate dehydratase
MRWFGPTDPVSLMTLRQAGCTGVVTALHHIPVGEIWSIEEILKRKALIEKDNGKFSPLTWEVVESLPVHEDIKKNKPNKKNLIENYKQSIENLAKCGIKTICYNFMPVLDWSRTQLNFTLEDGGKALKFTWIDFAIFDLFILKRPNASDDYSENVLKLAEIKFKNKNSHELAELSNTVLLGLPGSKEAFDINVFQSLLDEYANIDEITLKNNLHSFIKQIAPFADKNGVRLCIHPDDPPIALLGLPRVVKSKSDLEDLFIAEPSAANGLTFCTGSLGVRQDNDLTKMALSFKERIYFAHLRAIKREEAWLEKESLEFYEAPHLNGDVDMYQIVKILCEEENRRKDNNLDFQKIPLRPDHGHLILDDLQKTEEDASYPGYSAIGRLKGLAELRGIELAIKRNLPSLEKNS